jgi:hypothetical protein
MSTEKSDTPTLDPSQRRLCPDGACVGVIGDDGKCKECGTVDPGWTGQTSTPVAAPSPSPETDAEPDSAPESDPPAAVPEGGFDPNRRLCSDGDCVGILDAKNRCKVCGRPG